MKIKAIAACGNGMGSSQMIKMKINKVFKRLGIDAEIGHMSVGEAKGVANNYDMIFVSETFTSQFRTGKDTKVIGLKNLLSEKEIEAKIREALDMPAVDGAGNMVKKNIPSKVRDFLMDYENTDAFKIMLSHRPDSFVFGQAADTWKIDLVVSGHVHGGQVRIPGKGGLYGGDQGWFPEYTDGIHHFKTVNHMIITRGLGSDKEKLPRFHNIPEIVVIRLEKR